MYIGGLDIGTTGCKIVLFDESGGQVMTEYREYEVKRKNGLHEVDVDAVFKAVCDVISATAPYDVAAIGVTSFGETFVVLDENDKPLTPSMLYTDPRGSEECKVLVEHFGLENLTLKTGTIPHEMYSIPKLMWLKKNCDNCFDKAKHILLMQDFIVYMLSGVAQIDYSLAARTAAFDIKEKCWIDEIFDYAGIDVSLMSKVVPSGTVAGCIKTETANMLGVSPNIKIVTGMQDQIASLTGAGVFDENCAADGIGTVECMPIVMKDIPTDFSLYRCGYSIVPHISGGYACYILSYAGGSTLKWFRDKLSCKDYVELDGEVSDNPTDLLVMPHFAGAATPYMDTGAKAAILGLTFEHTSADIYKALMEGTTYEILLNIKKMEEIGVELKSVVATGGGAKSDVWLQIKADILGIPITALEKGEVGAAGTAMLAGSSAGVYEKGTRFISERKVFYPDEKRHEYYTKNFEKYAKIYDAVRGIINE